MTAAPNRIPGSRGRAKLARVLTRRSLVVVFAVLAAVLVPVVALGAAGDWWFLKVGRIPEPMTAPQVVTEGEWDGHPWQLIGYRSARGLCISLTPKASLDTGLGGALGCGPFVGVTLLSVSYALPNMPITFLAGSASEQLPAHIAGAVIEEASVVEIRFADDDVLRAPTFAGRAPLQHVRFFAAQLPTEIEVSSGTLSWVPSSVAGLDASGNLVACLAPQAARNGTSSLSDCR
jgi:hypothetical protein